MEFSFSDVPSAVRGWWLVITPAQVDVCDVDPSYDVRLTVRTSSRSMVQVWRGDVPLTRVMRSGDLVLDGDTTAQRAFPRWLLLSTFAATPRPESIRTAARRVSV